MNKVRAVVDGHDLGAFGQAAFDLGEPVLDAGDDRQRILAVTLHGDAGNDLALAIQLRHAAPLVRRKLDARNVLQQHWRSSLGLQDDVLDVSDARADSRARAP